MAAGPTDLPAPRRPADWPELLRAFPIALDPRKLLMAAAGVLAMSLGWYLLSLIVLGYYGDKPPDRNAPAYQVATVSAELQNKKTIDGNDYSEADYRLEAERRFAQDSREWRGMADLAAPGGRLRTMPWREYRGENPFTILSEVVGGSALNLRQAGSLLVEGTLPVLVEPFTKLFLPVVRMLDPNLSFWTRVYLLAALVWTIAVWAFAGGVITRLAASDYAGTEYVSYPQAAKYVIKRYVHYVASPLAPVIAVALIVILMALYGFVALIPILGDVFLYGLGFPLVILGGAFIAFALVGLIGYPLMYPTVSAEGSDFLDTVSRSYSYVFQAPVSYLWYNLVSLLWGSLAVLFVVTVASLAVYLGKFAVSQAPLSEYANRKPDYLFVRAPESFGWRQLLLEGSPVAVEPRDVPSVAGTPRRVYVDRQEAAADFYRKETRTWNSIGAFLVTAWLVMMMLAVIGFSYSYFWTAATIIYLLMRRKVDETELSEVYVDDDFDAPSPSAPATPTSPAAFSPPPAPAPATTAGAMTSLPMAPPPAASAPAFVPPPVPPPLPTAPATITVPPPGQGAVVVSAEPAVPPAVVPEPVHSPTVSPATEPPLFPPPTAELKRDAGEEFKKAPESE